MGNKPESGLHQPQLTGHLRNSAMQLLLEAEHDKLTTPQNFSVMRPDTLSQLAETKLQLRKPHGCLAGQSPRKVCGDHTRVTPVPSPEQVSSPRDTAPRCTLNAIDC